MLSSVRPTSPPFSTEGLYLGGATAEDGNARARAGHPGSRTEWARHQATPGLTVSAANGDSGSLETQPRVETLSFENALEVEIFLSGGSLTSRIARS